MNQQITIDKLVAGGQGLGALPDGRKVFVWGVLPGETVTVQVSSEKKSYAEGELVEVNSPAKTRVEPKEINFLDTSPWQNIEINAENGYKTDIVRELYARAHVDIPEIKDALFVGDEYGYRNSYVFRFCLDKNSELSLATIGRKSNALVAVAGSMLAREEINIAAEEILVELKRLHIKPTTLGTMELRCSRTGEVVTSLITHQKHMPKLHLPGSMKGLKVNFRGRNTKTEHLYTLGSVELSDMLLGKTFAYDVDSFFQVNVSIYEKALETMQSISKTDVVDMYAGVGTIGISLAKTTVTLVESNAASAAWAKENLLASGLNGEAVRAQSERSLAYIVADKTIVFDPPRAGLDKTIIERLLEVKPGQVLYLSCDPATQARDVARLLPGYKIAHMSVYNFFPHTPHIETLVVLESVDTPKLNS